VRQLLMASRSIDPGDASRVRALVRAGAITSSVPLVPIGDSHTDNATSAHYLWDLLKANYNQAAEGLDGVASAAIVPMGNNGQTLANYLAGGGTNTLSAAMALNPSVVLACWLTNDVRLGGLGLTVPAITSAGAALLIQLIDAILAAQPAAKIVLRVPAPYLTANVALNNYITDGANVNPPGLAQIYTTGVRLAHYAARRARPQVVIYDPQARLFGTESPTAVGTYFADQIHQNQAGYEAEAQDFASWVAGESLFSQASADAALVSSPYAPWTAYNRAVEDGTRFVKVADANAVTVTSGNTFLDFGPSDPNAQPAAIDRYDIVAPTASGSSFLITPGSTISASASNTRVSLGASATVPASAVAKTHVRVYRQVQSGDSAVNAILNGSSSFRRTGRISAGGTSFMDITAYSLTNTKPSENASAWVASMQSGDKIYIEGFGATPITLTSNFAVSGNALRATGLAGTDWSLYVGRIAVVYRA
jgi:hypothetical protein